MAHDWCYKDFTVLDGPCDAFVQQIAADPKAELPLSSRIATFTVEREGKRQQIQMLIFTAKNGPVAGEWFLMCTEFLKLPKYPGIRYIGLMYPMLFRTGDRTGRFGMV